MNYYQYKQFFYIIVCVFLFSTSSNADSKETSSLLGNLANKTFKMQYYFVQSELKNYFLLRMSGSNFSMWHFTLDKKWEPVHNSGEYDGFELAKDNIVSASYKDKYLTIGSSKTSDDFKFKQELVDKTLEVLYYFWITNSKAYLIRPTSSTNVSLWYFTQDKSWMPLHNAGPYDKFPKADKTILDIKFDFATTDLSVGDLNPFTNICLDTGFCP